MSADDDLEKQLLHDPLNLSEAQHQELQLRHGRTRGLQRYQDAVNRQLRSIKLAVPGGRRR